MTHWEKVAFYFNDRRYTQNFSGVWSNRVPLPYRIFRRLGIKARPPIFLSFPVVAAVYGLCFALPLAALTQIHWWGRGPVSLAQSAVAAVTGGTIYGCLSAFRIRLKAKNLNLPAWADYPSPEDRETAAAMLETMEISADPAVMAAIADAEANQGRTYWLEDIPD